MGEVVNSAGAVIETDDETGRLVRQTGLTEKQEIFASGLARGMTPVEAGRLAGYATPGVTSYKVRNSPAVREKVFRLREARIQRMAGLALNVIQELLQDKKTAGGVRLEAAKYTLKLAGHEKEAETISKDKPLGEMTLAELERLKAAHDALQTVGKSQTIDQDTSQVTDIIEEDPT